MAELLDSGARREFGNGAVRDVAEGKGRCDLLPLHIIGDRLESRVLHFIEDYIRLGDVHSLQFAINGFIYERNWDIHTALLEVAKQYEDGARKYDQRNWERGIPSHVFIDSGVRHYLKFLRGDTDEPHDRAFIWNMLGAIWTHENKPELIDLPFAEQSKPNRPTQADLEELFTEPSEPVKGKYERLSIQKLLDLICERFDDEECSKCPLEATGSSPAKCSDSYLEQHPEEFRKIAIAYLAEQDKAKEGKNE